MALRLNVGHAGEVADEYDTPEYDTPEDAALSGWGPEWQARVIETRYESADRAIVLVDTTPSHPMEVICERIDGRWIEGPSHSA